MITKISLMGRQMHFLRYGATLACTWSPAINVYLFFLYLEFVTGCFHFQPSLELVASIPEFKNIP